MVMNTTMLWYMQGSAAATKSPNFSLKKRIALFRSDLGFQQILQIISGWFTLGLQAADARLPSPCTNTWGIVPFFVTTPLKGRFVVFSQCFL